MKYFFFFLSVLLSLPVCSQKRIEHTYDASSIKRLVVDSNEIFEINITTSPRNTIIVGTQIDGETYESTLLNVVQLQDKLVVKTGKTPDFTPFNDKLSAHKVMSIVLHITVPAKTEVEVFSTLASLKTKGDLGNLKANLGRGGCSVERFRESALINTISGNITIETAVASISAQSRNGNVVIPQGISGKQTLDLNSIHGDITVSISQ